MNWLNQVLNGNCMDIIPTFPKESMDVIITSSPYFHQRIYELGNECIYGGDPKCKHVWERCPITWRHPTPGDKPSKYSTVAGRRTNNENRPAKESLKCACGAWKGDLGLEPNPHLFIQNLCDIYDLCRPTLKSTGLLFANLGEKYNDSGGAGNQYSKWREKHYQFGKVNGGVGECLPCHIGGLQKGTALGIPWLFADEMIYNRGWILKDTLIWQKKVPMPFSGDRKFTIDYEPIFVFANTPDYYFKQQKVERVSMCGIGNEFGGQKAEGYGNPVYSGKKFDGTKDKMKNRRTNLEEFDSLSLVDSEYLKFLEACVYGQRPDDSSVFKINTSKCHEKHHAPYPVELVRMMIDAGCPEGGVVMDPFGGIGQSAIGACELNRDFVIIELCEEYADIARTRVYNAQSKRDFKRNADNLDDLK